MFVVGKLPTYDEGRDLLTDWLSLEQRFGSSTHLAALGRLCTGWIEHN